MNMAKKVLLLLTGLTIAVAVYYIIANIIACLTSFTSFPWWSALVFAVIYFGPVLALEGIGFLVIRFLEKRKK